MSSFTPSIGQKVRLLKTPFSPEAIGEITDIRGYGTLQGIEVRVSLGQPGAQGRIAHTGQWEPLPESEGGGR